MTTFNFILEKEIEKKLFILKSLQNDYLLNPNTKTKNLIILLTKELNLLEIERRALAN